MPRSFDGPVGKLLKSLNRHVFRPAHLHMCVLLLVLPARLISRLIHSTLARRMFIADGYETLITALYFKGDPYLNRCVLAAPARLGSLARRSSWLTLLPTVFSLHLAFPRPLSTFLDLCAPLLLRSDAVFGVKTSLIVDTELVTDDARARQLGFKHGPYSYLNKDYVLLTTGQAEEAKRASLANYYKSIQQ